MSEDQEKYKITEVDLSLGRLTEEYSKSGPSSILANDLSLSVGSKLLGWAAAGIARYGERVLATARAGGLAGSLSPNPSERASGLRRFTRRCDRLATIVDISARISRVGEIRYSESVGNSWIAV